MLFLSQTLFMLHHKIWSSQIRTTLCEEHSESLTCHRLKLPKLLCVFRSDRFFHFSHTEITKLIYVFNLGATDLNFSVSPSCCNCQQLCISVPPSCSTRSHRQCRAIYTHGQILESLLQNSSLARSSLCLLGLRIVDFVASYLLLLVSAAINGFLLRRCRRSEFTAELGYGLDHSAIPVQFLAHCVHYDSCHDWNASI